MSGTDIAAIIGAAGVFLATVGRGFSWVIGLLTTQYKETIQELKSDRDLWRERAHKAGWKGEP